MRLHMNAADVRGLVASHFLKLGADADDVAEDARHGRAAAREPAVSQAATTQDSAT